MRRKKIYLSGPISGYKYEERKCTFSKIREIFELVGYEVMNPLENGLPQEASTKQHMKEDIKMLLESDKIFMMNGWNHSAGCHTELSVATALGLEVLFESIATSTIIISPIGGLSVVKTEFK